MNAMITVMRNRLMRRALAERMPFWAIRELVRSEATRCARESCASGRYEQLLQTILEGLSKRQRRDGESLEVMLGTIAQDMAAEVRGDA